MNAKPETQLQMAARLSIQLGFIVTRKQVRTWISKGFPMDDVAEIKRRLRNQERVGGGKSSAALPGWVHGIEGPDQQQGPETKVKPSAGDIPVEFAVRREAKLCAAFADFFPERLVGLSAKEIRDMIISIGWEAFQHCWTATFSVEETEEFFLDAFAKVKERPAVDKAAK